MTEEILRLALELGCVGDGERSALEVLCARAEDEMAGRLKAGIAPGDCVPAFTLGCAWLALADLRVGREEDGFTAGGLTIRPGKGADGLRRRAETVMAPYLRDEAFGFAGVRG